MSEAKKNETNNNGSRSNSSSSSSSSLADETFGRKDGSPRKLSGAGYFSSVFPPASAVTGNHVSHSDLHWALDKNRYDGEVGSAQNNHAGTKSQESQTKLQTLDKDEKSIYANEWIESSYFGSSVHYGGRDFYTSSSSKQASESKKNYKIDDSDDMGNTNVAIRGEWWQGSFYY